MAALHSTSAGAWGAATGLLLRLWITAHSGCCSLASLALSIPLLHPLHSFLCSTGIGAVMGKSPPLQLCSVPLFRSPGCDLDADWSCFLPMCSGAVGQVRCARRAEPQGIVYQWEWAGEQVWAGSGSAGLVDAGPTCSRPIPGCV